jgi:hypothetical protein
VEVETNTAKLKAWYQTLDAQMKTAVSAFSDEDLKKLVDRSKGYSMSVEMQLDVYLQAVLIFFGKVTIYLKAMNKPLPETVQEYIG